MRFLLFLLLVITCAAADSTSVPASSDTVLTSDTLKPAPDSTDSLKAGKADGAGLNVTGTRGLGASFAFTIPISRELQALRSAAENAYENARYSQDPKFRFDDNDIHLAPSFAFRYRAGRTMEPRLDLSYIRIRNENRWTPKTGDTVYTTPQAHRYALDALRLSAGAEFNIDPTLMTVDNFERFYMGFEGIFLPVVRLVLERNSRSADWAALGMGYGARAFAGVEKAVSPISSIGGEIAFGFEQSFALTTGGRKLTGRDALTPGGNEPYAPAWRALSFRFYWLRWY